VWSEVFDVCRMIIYLGRVSVFVIMKLSIVKMCLFSLFMYLLLITLIYVFIYDVNVNVVGLFSWFMIYLVNIVIMIVPVFKDFDKQILIKLVKIRFILIFISIIPFIVMVLPLGLAIVNKCKFFIVIAYTLYLIDITCTVEEYGYLNKKTSKKDKITII